MEYQARNAPYRLQRERRRHSRLERRRDGENVLALWQAGDRALLEAPPAALQQQPHVLRGISSITKLGMPASLGTCAVMLLAVWAGLLEVTRGPLCMQSLRPSKCFESSLQKLNDYCNFIQHIMTYAEQTKFEAKLTCPLCENLNKLQQ